MKPKTLEAALKQFRIAEFKSGLDKTLCYYVNNPGMWIREAALHLNECLASVEPPVDYAGDLFSAKPVALLTKELKKTLATLMEDCGDAGRQQGYEALVANLAYDLAKSIHSNVTGYLILLQMLAQHTPSLALSNIKRFAELIHSYQNQAGVCIPVLWAIGQSGKTDLATGIKVWLEFMKPLIRLKHYSRHVVSYITGIWEHHPGATKSLDNRVLYPSHFFAIFDAMFSESSSNISKDLQKEFQSVFPLVKAASIGDCSLDHELFPSFLSRLSTLSMVGGATEDCRKLMTECVAECLANNPLAVASHWQQQYRSHFTASAYILDQLGSKTFAKKIMGSHEILHNVDQMESLVEAFQEYNSACSPLKEGLVEAKRGCKNLLANFEKMRCVGSGSSLPYKTMIVLLAVGLGMVVNNDIERKGSFKASSTGLFLQDVGMYDRAVDTFHFTVDSFETSREIAEHYLPIYINHTRENLGPALTKAAQQAQWAWTQAAATGSDALQKANVYLPGAKEKAILFCSETSRIVVEYSEWFVGLTQTGSTQAYKMALEATQSAKLTTQAVIDGEIDLKDVYNGAVDLGNKALLKFEEIRQTLVQQATAANK